MADVFISYRHIPPDQDLAIHLAAHLTRQNISHFLDTKIDLGQKWVEVIDRELRACQSLIVLLSADSIRSDMVRQEVSLAHQYQKKIVPIRVAYEGALPYDLGAFLDPIQYALWRTGDPFDLISAKILDTLRTGAAAPPPNATASSHPI